MINIPDLTIDNLEKYLFNIGAKKFRATQILKWIYRFGVTDFSLMKNIDLNLRNVLKQTCEIKFPNIIKCLIDLDGTTKWLMKLSDGALIETVFIPEKNRGTLCVSSQVGCLIGCKFCATGLLGFTRNLTISEIIGQLWVAYIELSNVKIWKRDKITNVVFMGMGEPLLNYSNVVNAIKIMLDDDFYGLSKYSVTISTTGLIPELQKLKKDTEVAVAISLHAPNDKLRNDLVPMNKKYPLSELIDICNTYFNNKRRYIMIEYIMLDGVNDKIEHAKQLVKLLTFGKYKINLIPMNNVSAINLSSTSISKIEFFRKFLIESGIHTSIRKSRGENITAACGQLVGI